ncbi:MAG: AI-2E family transporter [Patescibacteria group bacterium]
MFNKNSSKDISININSGTIIRTILFLLLLVFLYFFRDLVLVILTAIIIASSIEPIIKWFTKHKIPRVLTVIFIYLGFFVLFAGIFISCVPIVLDEMTDLLTALPQYIGSVDLWNPMNSNGFLSQSAMQNLSSGFSLSEVLLGLKSTISNTFGSFWQVVSVVFGGLFSFILIVILSFYFAVQKHGIENFLRVITSIKHEKYIINLWRRSQLKIGLWMQGQLLLALVIGVFVYLGLMILGIKYAFLLALFAIAAELIPLFGPILASIPAILIGFASGGASLGLLVIGLYVIIQQFENHLIYPLVVKKVVGVPPLMVILALLVGGQLAGFLGIIIAVPVAATIMEFLNDLEEDKKKLMKIENGKIATITKN